VCWNNPLVEIQANSKLFTMLLKELGVGMDLNLLALSVTFAILLKWASLVSCMGPSQEPKNVSSRYYAPIAQWGAN